MLLLAVICILSISVVAYHYAVYPLLLYIAIRIKRLLYGKTTDVQVPYLPEVTFLVAAYNEEDFIEEKIKNTLSLHYPKELIHYIFITDGSTDRTNELIRLYPQITLLYEPQRAGKTAAINRAMSYVQTPFVVLSDANTILNSDAAILLMSHFRYPDTGAVAGEKKVISTTGGAESQGEGMYWKYESLLKKWDAELYSVMGAAGELIAVRTSVYDPLPTDTILDDFMLSFNMNMKGYRVLYEPAAYAQETASASLPEEYKRKVRIAAGGYQSMSRLLPLLNPFKYPKITWQYVSHRVLRWTLAPLGLLLAIISNMLFLIIASPESSFYQVLLITGILQLCFYTAALMGYLLAIRETKVKYLYIPFYFVFMNFAVFAGSFKFFRKKQSAAWERSKRSVAVS
ncbi:glycosyltransferase family 2 protein [Chitinophaga silvatica]|uniref:Glycosyltransferase family 2 protein n=1 Tax=Chitinophaga silvatica TaxID=2282649 RepID=A0A3E1Y4H4_9BACT|nr:glycosyltransferase family 2 protein [Chitinophaga silvatica]RFS19563.1 glycosyltransferase family 2 protein [Chitinophaga silvatica]